MSRDRNRARISAMRIGDREVVVIGLPVESEPSAFARLTEAERAVARLLLAGRSNGQIAEVRGVSYRTVANQVAAIFRKLGVSSRAELAARTHGAS